MTRLSGRATTTAAVGQKARAEEAAEESPDGAVQKAQERGAGAAWARGRVQRGEALPVVLVVDGGGGGVGNSTVALKKGSSEEGERAQQQGGKGGEEQQQGNRGEEEKRRAAVLRHCLMDIKEDLFLVLMDMMVKQHR